jgi:short-subunit dehydrogenase
LARAWAKSGAKLTLVARRKELLDQLAGECGGDVLTIVHDLSVPAKAVEWLAEAEARHGPIDVLVNNAGMENVGSALLSDPAMGEKVLALNLQTPLLLTRAVLPRMVERKSGVIVQVASVAALVGTPGMTWYSASKAGLAQFTETLRGELRGTGVSACIVYPGPIKTPMGEGVFPKYGGREGPAGRAPEGTPEKLAEMVLAAVDRKSPRVIYPRIFWLAWLFPWFFRVITFLVTPPLVE